VPPSIETLVRAGRAVGADIELRFVPMKKNEVKDRAAKPKAAEDPTPYRATRKPKP
jgi:hypothetical protein